MSYRRALIWALILSFLGCATAPTPPIEPLAASKVAVTSSLTYAAPASEAWRTNPPDVAPPRVPRVPTEFKLENGLRVFVLPRTTMPLLQAAVVTSAGAALDPKDRAGLAYLTHTMLRDGSGVRESRDFERSLKDIGGEMSTVVDVDRGIISIRGLPRFGEQILELLSDAVARPELPKETLELRRTMELQALERRRADPMSLARLLLAGVTHGETHPLGHSVFGTKRTLDLIKRKDVTAFYDGHIVPERSALILAGAWQEKDIKPLVERFFGRWIGTGEAKVPKPAALKVSPQKTLVVHRENSVQSFVCFSRSLVPAGHADELPLEVANHVLGGSFGSRLSSNLREDKGFTYGINSVVDMHGQGGDFTLCSSVKREVTAKALEQISLELKGMTERPPTDDEVRSSARALAGSAATLGQTVSSAIDSTARQFSSRRKSSHSADRIQALMAIDPERVREVAKKYFDASTMQVLLVGDARVLTPLVQRVGLSSPNVIMSP
ncbi:MAG: insulinase family protein [Deltaproteobacteria bacterium]|nr:insulinase family protein [Deltaproteobacteria bacterium]